MTEGFQPWPKIARLGKLVMTVTEKIDGTNAQVHIINPMLAVEQGIPLLAEVNGLGIAAASRNRYVTREKDNAGWAKFVQENAEELAKLGEGRHYGEWWGHGIQRGYGLSEKRFSLFNTFRWAKPYVAMKMGYGYDVKFPRVCELVPLLYHGPVDLKVAETWMDNLADPDQGGSRAAPGWLKPEGIIINIGGVNYKQTYEATEGKWKEASAA